MKNKLNIIQTPARYYPYIGGVEKYVMDLSNKLVNLGNNVVILCADEPVKSPKKIGKVTVRRLAFMGKIANTNITVGLVGALFKENIDVIHTHIPTPWSSDISALVSILRRKPLVVTYHNDILKNDGSRLVALIYNNTFLKFTLGTAKVIIITQKNYLKSSLFLGKYKNKVRVVPNGVDLANFKDAKVKKESNSVFFLSSLDRYHRYKGLPTLLLAIKLLAEKKVGIKLYVGGFGELLPEYRNLAHEYGIEKNVEFVGHIPDKKLNAYFQKSSVFVLPSNSFEEGFGIVLLEAMANKIPIIATSFVGVADDIKKWNAGIIVEKNNPTQLANAIYELVKNRKKAIGMGEAGRKLIEDKYSWESISQAVNKIYQEII